MLLTRMISYGSQGYPEREARRIRTVNVAAWLAGLALAFFLIVVPGPPHPLTLVLLVVYAATPLLHRFGPVVAPLVVIVLLWVHVTRVILTIGTGDGVILALLSIAAVSVLLFGPKRLLISGLVAIFSCGIAVALFTSMPFSTGDVPDEALRLAYVINFVLNLIILFGLTAYVTRIAFRAELTAERERARSESLLINILPASVAERLKEAPGVLIADRFEMSSVLFADIAGFTERAGRISPDTLVIFLNEVFGHFDTLVARHGLEKIKSSGDSYMVVSGVPEPRSDHAGALARFALDLRDAALEFRDPDGQAVPFRIGLAAGPVVAGVVGTRKFFYDVWGDTVNTASRMETTGEPGRIQVTPEMARLLQDEFVLEPRGPVEIKGKGPVETWFLESMRVKAGTHL